MKFLLSGIFALLTLASFSQEAMFEICPIKNSEKVPGAQVYKTDGTQLNLQEYIGEKPAVLVFYRGGWCPYCMRHLSALHESKQTIDSLGFELIAITPDDFSRLDTSLVRSGAEDYLLLSDKDISAIDAFGIGWKVNDELYTKYKDKYGMDLEWWNGTENHVLPVPAVFILKDGEIQFQHVDPNYSKRLSPELLIAYLKELS